MKVPMCARLLACCSYINQGASIADVGCDHGYLPIYLLKSGRIRHAICSDIREQPLQKAVANAEKFGVRDRMSFFVCSGAEGLPHCFDTLVCAGMGAETMVSILKGAPWLQGGRYRLILQCQRKGYFLRRYLSDSGWEIARETVVRDGRFLYTALEACWNPGCSCLTPGDCCISPALLADSSPELPAYFRWVYRVLAEIAEGRKPPEDSPLAQALRELKEIGRKYSFYPFKEERA